MRVQHLQFQVLRELMLAAAAGRVIQVAVQEVQAAEVEELQERLTQQVPAPPTRVVAVVVFVILLILVDFLRVRAGQA